MIARPAGTEFHVAEFPTDATFSINHPWMLEQGTERVVVRAANVDTNTQVVTLNPALRHAIDLSAGATFNNNPSRQLVTATAAGS